MKRNVRKIPPKVMAHLQSIPDRYVVAGCGLVMAGDDIRAGRLRHLGITLADQGLVVPKSVLPKPEQGKYSRKNAEGEVVKREDLGLQTFNRTVDTPNWGDWSNGSHEVDLPYEAYPRQFIPPQMTRIDMECQDSNPKRERYAIAFKVDEVLDRQAKDFEAKLLRCINLLQENIYDCDVQAAKAHVADYLKSLTVSWEILPPGTADEAVERLFRDRKPMPQEEKDVRDRWTFLVGLNPANLVYGTSGFYHYFGAMLRDDLVFRQV